MNECQDNSYVTGEPATIAVVQSLVPAEGSCDRHVTHVINECI